MKDVLGRDILVGDRVALASQHQRLLTGTVLAFREEGQSKVRYGAEVQVRTDKGVPYAWNGGSTRWYQQDHSKFVLIRAEE